MTAPRSAFITKKIPAASRKSRTSKGKVPIILSRSNPLTFTVTTNLVLFARFQPFTLKWVNTADGDWNAATNWTPNLAPSTNEDVLIAHNVTVSESSNVYLRSLVLANATLSVGGSVTVSNLALNGTVAGTGQLTLTSAGVWTAGTMRDAGETIIASNATLSISNTAGDVVLNFRTLDNAGTVNWVTGTGGLELYNSGVITNEPGSRFELQNPKRFYFHQFGNGGPVRFDNAGTLQIPGGGTTAFSGIPLNNYNFIDLHTGALAVNGGYNSISNSVLYSALAGTLAGINYGQLLISGVVTLAGTISVGLTDGYVPATNTTFTLVKADTRKGMFFNFGYPAAKVALTLTNTPTDVIAIVTNDVVPSGQILPALNFEGLSAAAASLSWSTNYPDFQLQYNASLASTNWMAYPDPPAVIGENFVVTNLLSNAPQFFFRLYAAPYR